MTDVKNKQSHIINPQSFEIPGPACKYSFVLRDPWKNRANPILGGWPGGGEGFHRVVAMAEKACLLDPTKWNPHTNAACSTPSQQNLCGRWFFLQYKQINKVQYISTFVCSLELELCLCGFLVSLIHRYFISMYFKKKFEISVYPEWI